MVMPEFNSADDVLEYAAQLIEEMSFVDFAGVWAKRKRDREDAKLRVETIEKTRKECASRIRAFKNRPDLDAKSILRDLAEAADKDAFPRLVDAWPLAWKGWLDIECTVICTRNTIPPEARYRIVLTDKGREVLEAEDKT